VLDVGAWNGCVSFECERRGAAEVVALSLEDPATTGFDRLSSVLEVARTRYVRGTIYDLNPDRLGLFDLVICFGVIYHLRYPVLGIDNLRRVANGDLYLETHISDAELGDAAQKPLLQFYPGDELVHASNWFGPTSTAVNLLLETAGFSIRTSKVVDGTRGYYRAAVKPGLPPFVGMFQDQHTYEEQYYDVNLSHLFGPLESLRR
jgi:tRNA (mo5U34)-methyltransferase